MAQALSDLWRAILIAALVFQGVIGNVHLAFAAFAPDGTPAQVICTAHGVTTLPSDSPGETPDEPDPQGQRNCPVCASNHQAAGSLLLPVATVGHPFLRQIRHFNRAHDQWPADRQPQFANSRAPPRPV
jgi:hypothetical protein